MEPLSVAGSIVGLLSAGAQLVSMFYNLASAIKDAPHYANAAVSELEAITMILTQLQEYINGTAQASVQRLSLIHVEHVTATLTECVMTYSQLNALLKTLHADKSLKAWDRAMWLLKKEDVDVLVGRLQNHKSTLGLMLQIIQCTTMAEAERNMVHLCNVVNEVLLSNKSLSSRLRSMEDVLSSRMSTHTVPTTEVNASPFEEIDERSHGTQLWDHGDDETNHQLTGPLIVIDWRKEFPAFEKQLHCSRVYRHASNRHSQSSLFVDGCSTLAISLSSSLTLGEISTISVYALPIFARELSNAECYAPVSDIVRGRQDPRKSFYWPNPYGRGRWSLDRPKQLSLLQRPSRDNVQHKPNRVFGVSLEDSIDCASTIVSTFDEKYRECTYGPVPLLIAECGARLREPSWNRRWLFTTRGSPRLVEELQTIFDEPPLFGTTVKWRKYTIYHCAGLLLEYLHQLPEPVIPPLFYDSFRQPIALLDQANFYVHESYKRLFYELPPSRRQVLLYLLDLLGYLGRKSVEISTLAATFQPVVIRSPASHLSPNENQENQKLVAFLIENQDMWYNSMYDNDDTINSAEGHGFDDIDANGAATSLRRGNATYTPAYRPFLPPTDRFGEESKHEEINPGKLSCPESSIAQPTIAARLDEEPQDEGENANDPQWANAQRLLNQHGPYDTPACDLHQSIGLAM